MGIHSHFPGAGEEKIINAKTVEIVAAEKIKIGDTVYTVENDPFLKGEFYYPALKDTVYTAAFSPDGSALVLGGNFSGNAKVYSVSGTTVTYVSDIYANTGTTALRGTVCTAAFSPDGSTLVLGGYFTGKAKVYSVSGTTVTYVSDIGADTETTALKNDVNTAAFSPDGSVLVLGGWFTGYAKVYSVSGTTITYVSDIYADSGTTELDDIVNTAAFSPDGSALVLGGQFIDYAKVYSVSGTTVTYVSDIYANAGTTALGMYVDTAAFSPDGNTLVLGGKFAGYAKVYSVSGTTVTYVSDIYANTGAAVFGNYVCTAAFSPDGSTLVLGGYFTGKAKVYSVNGTTVTYVSDIGADTGGAFLSNHVHTVALPPNGSTLVLGGQFIDYAKVYSVSGTAVTYVSDIYADTGTTTLSNSVNAAVFSPDGNTLVLGGNFSGGAKVYSVSGTTVTYVSDIYAGAGTTALNSHVKIAVFSPDGATLVLGGWFTGFAKVYSVSGTTVTYVSDIYADAGTTALKSTVHTATFSADGSALVLGGEFAGRAKVYSVSGTTVTYVSDIYADTGTTALDGYVNAAVFSPDGSILLLGGWFTDSAKVYSVSGTTVTYVGDIYEDSGTTVLDNLFSAAVFSPDGSTLVLGGWFTGYAKVYSVSGTTITYVSDIYADSGTTALSSLVNTAAFSPDGSALVLGGNFAGKAKVYSVSGTTITYVSDIYADAGTTAFIDNVNTAAFSPDGSALVLGGQFTGYAMWQAVCKNSKIFVPEKIGYPAKNGEVALREAVEIGFSKANMEARDVGKVKLIAHVSADEAITEAIEGAY